MVGTLLSLFLVIVLIGVLFWAANRILAVLPVEEPFRTIAYVILVLVAVLIAFVLLRDIVGQLGGHVPSLTLR